MYCEPPGIGIRERSAWARLVRATRRRSRANAAGVSFRSWRAPPARPALVSEIAVPSLVTMISTPMGSAPVDVTRCTSAGGAFAGRAVELAGRGVDCAGLGGLLPPQP